jgi:hypothetical protein
MIRRLEAAILKPSLPRMLRWHYIPPVEATSRTCVRRPPMQTSDLLERFIAPGGTRWVDLRVRPDGLFFFEEHFEDRDETPGYGVETFITPGWQSGLYERREDAARDLEKMAPWLRT